MIQTHSIDFFVQSSEIVDTYPRFGAFVAIFKWHVRMPSEAKHTTASRDWMAGS